MTIDLHTHSSVSDGVDDPADLIQLAADHGVEVIALTDHDTLDGIERAALAAEHLGIEFIPGIELSVDHEHFKIHLLAYFIEPGDTAVEDRLQELRDGRDARNIEIVERLRDLGYAITVDDVQRHAAGPSVGRPHIADALIEKGYFPHRDAVFDDLLRDGGRAYVSRIRLGAIEAIELVRSRGGVPVIAHPATIRATAAEYDRVFRDLRDAGLGGIEAHHPMHDPAVRGHLVDVAHSLGIAATGGSDYHGSGKRPYALGVGSGDLRVPASALGELQDQRSR